MLDRSAFFFDSRRARAILRRTDPVSGALLIGSLAASVGGSVLAAKAAKGKTPQLQPTPKMPDPNDPEAQAARQREQERLAADQGRQSTILAPNATPTSLLQTAPAAVAYTNQKLGQ